MRGATRHCCFGVCRSDSRDGLRSFNPSVTFFPFPKPCLDFRKAFALRFVGLEKHGRKAKHFAKTHCASCSKCAIVQKWVIRCRRQERFSHIGYVTKDTYICSLHFPPNTAVIDTSLHLPGETVVTRRREQRTRCVADSDVLDQPQNRPQAPLDDSAVTAENSGLVQHCESNADLNSVQAPSDDSPQSSLPVGVADSDVLDQPQNRPQAPLDDSAVTAENSGLVQHCESNADLNSIQAPSDDSPQSSLPVDLVEVQVSNPDVTPHHSQAPSDVSPPSTQTTYGSEDRRKPAVASQGSQTEERKTRNTSTQCSVSRESVSLQTSHTSEDLRKMETDLQYYRNGYYDLLRLSCKSGDEVENMSSTELCRFEVELKDDPKMAKRYCGFTYSQLSAIFDFVQEPVLQRWGKSTPTVVGEKTLLSPMQEFLVTIMRIRSGAPVYDLSYRFKISEGLVSQTVTTWILLMHQKFDSLRRVMFPSREKIRENLPKRFSNMRNIRVIIDGAEVFCETPSDFSQQSNTYSQYKAHATWKLLVGCTPTGAISFVSRTFEGSISDRQLVIDSGLLELMDKSDVLLADRGFTIADLTASKGINLRIPAFLHGRDRLTPQEEMETRTVARNRIFVEHAIRRIKEFKILQGVMPQTMRHLVDPLIFVCACLSNFQEPINN